MIQGTFSNILTTSLRSLSSHRELYLLRSPFLDQFEACPVQILGLFLLLLFLRLDFEPISGLSRW